MSGSRLRNVRSAPVSKIKFSVAGTIGLRLMESEREVPFNCVALLTPNCFLTHPRPAPYHRPWASSSSVYFWWTCPYTCTRQN